MYCVKTLLIMQNASNEHYKTQRNSYSFKCDTYWSSVCVSMVLSIGFLVYCISILFKSFIIVMAYFSLFLYLLDFCTFSSFWLFKALQLSCNSFNSSSVCFNFSFSDSCLTICNLNFSFSDFNWTIYKKSIQNYIHKLSSFIQGVYELQSMNSE